MNSQHHQAENNSNFPGSTNVAPPPIENLEFQRPTTSTRSLRSQVPLMLNENRNRAQEDGHQAQEHQEDRQESEIAAEEEDRQQLIHSDRNSLNYAQVRQQSIDIRVNDIKSTNIMDLLTSSILLTLVIFFGSKAQCGIPVYIWNLVYVILIVLRSVGNLLKIPLIRRQSTWQNNYSLLLFIIVDGAYLAWLIYGNVLYYSKENNCGDNESSKMLNRLMLLLLVIGYFQMMIYGLIIFCLPCIILSVRNLDQRPGGLLHGQSIQQVVESLSRQKFNTDTFQHEQTCPICYVEYMNTDEITLLQCDPKHYFHSECIILWVNNGNNSCPMCRKPIKEL